jgi:hypothetical protein
MTVGDQKKLMLTIQEIITAILIGTGAQVIQKLLHGEEVLAVVKKALIHSLLFVIRPIFY